MIKWIALMPIGLTLLLVFGAIFDRSPIELVVIVWFFICIFGVIYAIDQFFNEEIK